MEFPCDMVTTVPERIEESEVAQTRAWEVVRSAELAAQGHLLHLWWPPVAPGEWRTLGLRDADDEPTLQRLVATMPLHVWMTVQVTPLQPHPNDPRPPTG